ncbi:MAG: histidine phosphatase family protein [Anaerolineae bacterium]|jgi:2,3-bisphosphoglycerate-dependent phosphoglycerate mutase
MQLYFIRHAQSQNNALFAQTGSFTGRSEDPDLTPTGRQQAEHLARFLDAPGLPAGEAPSTYDAQNLGGFDITHLYCSLMIRSVATGVVVARSLGVPLVAWEEMHEVGGILERDDEEDIRIGLPGKNRAYFERRFPDLVLPDRLDEGGWWNRPAEKREQGYLRARQFWSDLLERHGQTEDHVAVISHGGFYAFLLRGIFDLSQTHWFALNNAAITRLDVNAEGLAIQYMNRADFLPRELIT